MNDPQQWQKHNEDFLAAALHWLRLRLKHQGGPLRGSAASASPRSKRFRRNTPEKPSSAAVDLSKTVTDAQLQQATAAMAAAQAVDPPPALIILGQRFGLSGFEQHVLLLCAAMELDTRIPALCAHAQHEPGRSYPTFALALTLFDDPAWEALSPERPLRYWQLIEPIQARAQPLTNCPLRADERIVNYLKGRNHLDHRLSPLLVPFDVAPDGALPPSQQDTVEEVAHPLKRASENGPMPVTQLVGPDVLSKQLVAQQVAADMNLQPYRLPAELLPARTDELGMLARLWQRESILLPLALYIDAHEEGASDKNEGASPSTSPPFSRFLARSGGVFFLSTRDVQPSLRSISSVVEVQKPMPAEQQAAWAEALVDFPLDSAALLAGQFNLNVTTIRQIARAEVANNGHGTHDRVWQACLVNTRPSLDRLAERLDPKATWKDIVLPEADMHLLRQLTAQVAQRTKVYDSWGFRQKMNRGFGINALFAGESGTGKTMAAEVIANDLHLNLYRIDLSAVVSKYIGETEKNLRRLFDAAEDGGAVLFFDEADALFGKRSEVKDSHDRYANIEINYLLQRMEAYNGLAILATNMKSALDAAFMRRLRFIINFPFPGVKERLTIWQKIWPPETPREHLDYDRLARFNLTGGSINNIVLNAAFMAAVQETPVTMPIVLKATQTEFRKLERPANEAEFRWNEPEEVAA